MEGLDRFHLFSDDDMRGSCVAEPVRGLGGGALRAVALGQRRMDLPLRFRCAEGRNVRDVVATTWIVPFLVSPRVLEALEGFTGWAAHPVRIDGPGGRRVEDYQALTVTGRSAAIDDGLSETVLLPPPVPEGREIPGLRGLLFDPSTWDGSDVFTPETTTFVMVTDAVREALEAASISNMRLEQITEIERMKP